MKTKSYAVATAMILIISGLMFNISCEDTSESDVPKTEADWEGEFDSDGWPIIEGDYLIEIEKIVLECSDDTTPELPSKEITVTVSQNKEEFEVENEDDIGLYDDCKLTDKKANFICEDSGIKSGIPYGETTAGYFTINLATALVTYERELQDETTCVGSGIAYWTKS
ncbi:MAG: hypothetical protein ACN4E2_06370 [Nitrospinota bacterium]